MKEHQLARVLTLLHCQQGLITMLQLMQNFSTRNASPIKYYMLLSKIKNK